MVKIDDKYVVPSGTQLFFINLQLSLITTKKLVVVVTHTITMSDDSFFGDLHEILFEHFGIPVLMKIKNGEISCCLSQLEPIGDTLKPKNLEIKYS